MKTITARLVRLACVLALLAGWIRGDAAEEPLPPAPAASFSVTSPTWGVLDSLTRLLPIDSYVGPRGGPLTLSGARGEVADGQLVLLAGPEAWDGVRLTFSALRGPQGARISANLLRWRQVGSVRTQKPYYDTRYVGLWPDPLLPAKPLDVPGQGRAVTWIDLAVPRNARAGTYTGTVTITASNAVALIVPLRLHIWGFTMPRQNHLQTSFGVQGQGNIPLDLPALYDDMFAHRVTPSHAPKDLPRLPPTTPGGPQTWDWTGFDREVPQRLAQGMTGFVAYLDSNNPSAEEWQAHLAQKGWLPLAYSYVADEPTADQLPALNDRLRQVRQAAPGIRRLMTARGFPDALTQVDIWCPDMIYFDLDQARKQQALGREVWWYPAYPTQHPHVNVWTDYPALDCRIWPWLTWKDNLDGMLYWSVCYWQNTPDPLVSASAFFGGDGPANGDGQLVYPGPDGKPLDSVRWEALRDGLQDYEVFCLLEAGAQELQQAHQAPALVAQARALTAIDPSVVKSDTDYNADPRALLAARDQMSRTLEQIVAALGHEPQITQRPRLHPEIARLQAQAQQTKALTGQAK